MVFESESKKVLQSLEQSLGISIPEFGYIDEPLKPGFRVGNPVLRENREHVVELYLSNTGLTSLPQVISRLPNLKMLGLDHNQIQNIDLTPLEHCPSLATLDLSHNKLITLDLAPLQHCPNLTMLDLSYNHLKNIELNFLTQMSSLSSLRFESNQLNVLDVTPLVNLPFLGMIYFDENVILMATPIPRDQSIKYTDFLRFNLFRIKWIIDENDSNSQELYQKYERAIGSFVMEEVWADFHTRRSAYLSDSHTFFDYAVEKFHQITSSEYTRRALQNTHENDNILQLQFLPTVELLSILKDHWENSYDYHLISVDLFANTSDEIVIIKYWPDRKPGLEKRNYLYQFLDVITSISWIRIFVLEEDQTYKILFGFNGGYLRQGELYTSTLLLKDSISVLRTPGSTHETKGTIKTPGSLFLPPDIIYSTEAMYECKQETTSEIFEILEKGDEWLNDIPQSSLANELDAKWGEFLSDT